jgi:ABC-2 type transport system ATP-binding protein
MVEACGLEPVIGRPVSVLSKGFKQRVGLAQTLIHDPEVLILDEPTTGLDPNQIVEIRDLIKEIGKEKTVILSSHILTEVQATCERILIIHEGKLVGSGTPEELSRQARGGDTLHLTVRSRSQRVPEDLSAIEGVIDCREAGEEEGALRLVATIHPSSDPREEIFRTAVRKRWVILEMHRESASLEDVFFKLTTGENQGA